MVAHSESTSSAGSVLRAQPVRRLVVGYGISALGSAMVGVAMAYVAYSESGSVVLTVLVLGANALPSLLLSPVVGEIATRYDPRTVEVAGHVLKVVLSVVLAFVAAAGSLTYAVLLVANVVNGTISALIAPAWPRLVKRSAPEGRLPEATASLSGAGAVSMILGAVIGGVVVSAFGSQWAFVANAVSYLPLIVAIRRVPDATVDLHRRRRTVRTGIGLVRDADVLRRSFVLAAVLSLAAWPVVSVLPAVANDIESKAHVLGILVGAFYAGAATVSWVTRWMGRRYSYSRVLFVGFFGVGVVLVLHATLIAWRTPGYDAVTVAVLTLVPIGLAISLSASMLQSVVQLGAPTGDQAPVLVVYATVTTVLTPLGGILIGAVADEISLWGALALSGVALVVLATVLRRRLTVFDRLQAPDASPNLARPGHSWHLPHLFGWDAMHGLSLDHHLALLDHTPATSDSRAAGGV